MGRCCEGCEERTWLATRWLVGQALHGGSGQAHFELALDQKASDLDRQRGYHTGRAVGLQRTDDPRFLHPLDHPGRTVVTDPQTALHPGNRGVPAPVTMKTA